MVSGRCLVGLVALALGACSVQTTSQSEQFVPQPKQQVFSFAAAKPYIAATVAEQQGDMAAAADLYVQALVQDPDNPELPYRVFGTALTVGNMDVALRMAKTFYPEDEPGALAWLILAIEQAQKDHFTDAYAYLNRAQQASPGLLQFEVIKRYFDIAADNHVAEALKTFAEFEAHPVLAARKLYHLGRMHMRVGDEVAAQAAWILANQLEPGALFTTRELGAMYERQGEPDKAKALYDAFMARNPNVLLLENAYARIRSGTLPPAFSSTLAQDLSETMFGFALLMWSQGMDLPARQLMSTTLWLTPKDSYMQYYAGLVHDYADRVPQALAHYRTIEADEPSWLASQLRMVELLARHGEHVSAIQLLEGLRQDYPHLEVLQLTLADMYYEHQDFKQAIAQYDALLQGVKEPTKPHVRLYFARGSSHERLQQYAQAEADLKQALALDGENATVLNYLGYMWLEMDKNIDQAFDYISKAVLLRPHDASIMDSLGWAYYKKGNYAQALLYLERALKMHATDATINEHLGDVYAKLARPDEAQQQWQRALELQPDKAMMQRLQRKLKALAANG